MNIKIYNYLIRTYNKMFKIYGKNCVSLIGIDKGSELDIKKSLTPSFEYKSLKQNDINSMNGFNNKEKYKTHVKRKK